MKCFNADVIVLLRLSDVIAENEKSNLLVVCRLVLRAFIEDAMGSGRRMIEGETQLIADLLVVLEKVLCHGFKGFFLYLTILSLWKYQLLIVI